MADGVSRFVDLSAVLDADEVSQNNAAIDGMSDADDDDDDPADHSDDKVVFRPASTRSAIPDADTIFSLKKQRESRRNQEEFISLVADTLPTQSADRKEKDDAEEEDDEEFEDQRIDFEVDKRKSERKKAQEAISLAQEYDHKSDKGSDSDSESSEGSTNEMSKWESEQIAKGVGCSSSIVKVKSVIESHSNEQMDVALSPQSATLVSLFDKKTGCSIPAHLTRSHTTSVTPDLVLQRLRHAMTEKKDKVKYLDNQLHSICLVAIRTDGQ